MRIITMLVVLAAFTFGCSHSAKPPADSKKDSADKKTAAKTTNTVAGAKQAPAKAVTKPKKQAEPKQKSTMTLAVEGVTGKTYIDAGLKSKAKIESISAKHNQELNEILGE